MYIPDRADLDPINPWRKGFTFQLRMFRGQCGRRGRRWRLFFRKLQSYSVRLLLDIKPAMFHITSSEQRLLFLWHFAGSTSSSAAKATFAEVILLLLNTTSRLLPCSHATEIVTYQEQWGLQRWPTYIPKASASWPMSVWGDRANDSYCHMLQAPPTTGLLKGWGDGSSACHTNKRTYVPPYHSGMVMPMLERWRQRDPWDFLASQQS